MKLFQYWDCTSPPTEVAGWIDGFRTRNLEFEHVLINAETAADLIADAHGARELAAFKACAVPAMQADYLRLCAICTFGGVYVDADVQSLAPLSDLVAQAPSSLILTYNNLFNNAFLMFREPQDAFIKACLALSTDNIETRRFNVVFTATGPGVLNAVRAILAPSSLPAILPTFNNYVTCQWGFDDLLRRACELIDPTPRLIADFRAMTVLERV